MQIIIRSMCRNLLDKNKITSVLFLYDCNHFVQDDKLSSILKTDKAE